MREGGEGRKGEEELRGITIIEGVRKGVEKEKKGWVEGETSQRNGNGREERRGRREDE